MYFNRKVRVSSSLPNLRMEQTFFCVLGLFLNTLYRGLAQVPNKAVVTRQPEWKELYSGEVISLSCIIQKLGDDTWKYEWETTSRNRRSIAAQTSRDISITVSTRSDGEYKCRGKLRTDSYSTTAWSTPVQIKVSGIHPSASLTVTPDRLQHFVSDSVSLRCSVNSSQWRVVSLQEDGFLRDCTVWKKTTEPTYTIGFGCSTGVYWCESGSGELSNAANITKKNSDIILVSPVQPVTEDSSVSLHCKLRKTDISSYVSFYQNDKLIQNDTRRELNISAVTKSSEGFYKCQTSGRESNQSWMSVKVVAKHERSSFPVIPVVVVLISFIGLLPIVVLLLYCYRRFKGTCLSRETTTSPSTVYVGCQQRSHGEYCSPRAYNVDHYETLKVSEDTRKHPERSKPASTEDHVYSEVK